MKEEKVTGKVKEVKKQWWLKINRKPIRFSINDGAIYPHKIKVNYEVDNQQYEKSKFVFWSDNIPNIGDDILIYYNKEKPTKVIRLERKTQK